MVAALRCVRPQFQRYQLAYATEMKSIHLRNFIEGLSRYYTYITSPAACSTLFSAASLRLHVYGAMAAAMYSVLPKLRNKARILCVYGWFQIYFLQLKLGTQASMRHRLSSAESSQNVNNSLFYNIKITITTEYTIKL